MSVATSPPLQEAFDYTRDVPPEWAAALADFSPKSPDHSWLELIWMGGWKYEPVQRWVIYEVWPVPGDPQATLDPADYMSLNNQSPRAPSMGEWEIDPTIPASLGGKRWISNSTMYYEGWLLHRKYKKENLFVYPRLLWICQGELGGHRYRLTWKEQALISAMTNTGRTDTPPPGDLPYADFDKRTLNQLRAYAELHDQNAELSKKARGDKKQSIILMNTVREQEVRAWRTKLAKFLEAQVEQAVDETYSFWKDADLPHGDRHYNRDEDLIDEAFERDKPPDTPEA